MELAIIALLAVPAFTLYKAGKATCACFCKPATRVKIVNGRIIKL